MFSANPVFDKSRLKLVANSAKKKINRGRDSCLTGLLDLMKIAQTEQFINKGYLYFSDTISDVDSTGFKRPVTRIMR